MTHISPLFLTDALSGKICSFCSRSWQYAFSHTFLREAFNPKRFMLLRFTAQVVESVDRTCISHEPLKSGAFEWVAWRKLLFKEVHRKSCFFPGFQKPTQISLKLSFLTTLSSKHGGGSIILWSNFLELKQRAGQSQWKDGWN